MKTFIWLSTTIAFGVVFAIGFTYVDWSTATEAQSVKVDPSKGMAVAFKANEIPIRMEQGTFMVDMPQSIADGDWIVAFNPIEQGQKERMFVTSVAYSAPADSMDISRVSNVENLTSDLMNISAGKMHIKDGGLQRGGSPRSLLILVEGTKDAQVTVNAGSRVINLNAANNLTSSYSPDSARALIPNVAVLLTELTTKRIISEAARRGVNVRRTDKGFTGEKGGN